MCANYRPTKYELIEQHFHAARPDADWKAEAYPGDMGPMIRRPRAQASPGERAAVLGMFGIVPHWAKDVKIARNTYNARTETVAEKPSFRNAFRRGQFCIIPAESIFEPNYESGKPVRWEITNVDGSPLAIAGLWDVRHDGPNALPLLSFTMLTINADDHPLMKRFHAPDDEKRMVVLLQPEQYDDWLNSPVDEAEDFFTPYPAERLAAKPAPRERKPAAKADKSAEDRAEKRAVSREKKSDEEPDNRQAGLFDAE